MESIIACNVKKIIETKGLKNKAIAKKAGYSSNSFSNMLNNRKIVTDGDIARLSLALGVTPNDLFGIPNRTPAQR